MSFYKIDETGCGISRGRAKIRISFYLEPTDVGYEKHHVYTVDTDSVEYKQGYPGEIDKMGQPIDEADYNSWIDGLPHRWQDNPFHNHFIYLDETKDISNIKAEIEDMRGEFFGLWAAGKKIAEHWKQMKSLKKYPVPPRNESASEIQLLAKINAVKNAVRARGVNL